ncbi:MAG TPA: hypothetical protein DD490_05965 [Acidobacteria bacterium]|nr:hypothetical protein [Acidobacteriota bacterium]
MYRELTRHLLRLGCQLARQSKGSHEIWHNPTQNRSTAIPGIPVIPERSEPFSKASASRWPT